MGFSTASLYAKIMNAKGIYKSALFLVTAYVTCWVLIYVLINQDLNMILAYEYFIMAWSFNGFIRPTYIWLLSNALFIVIVFTYFVIRRKGARGH